MAAHGVITAGTATSTAATATAAHAAPPPPPAYLASPPPALSVRVPIAGVRSAEKQDRGRQQRRAEEALEQLAVQEKEHRRRQQELAEKHRQLETEQQMRLQEIEQKIKRMECERLQQQQQMERERVQRQLDAEQEQRAQQEARQRQQESQQQQELLQQQRNEEVLRQGERLLQQRLEQQQQQQQQQQVDMHKAVVERRSEQGERVQKEPSALASKLMQSSVVEQQVEEHREMQGRHQQQQQQQQQQEKEIEEEAVAAEEEQPQPLQPPRASQGSPTIQSTGFWVEVEPPCPGSMIADETVSDAPEQGDAGAPSDESGFWIDLSRSQQEEDCQVASTRATQRPRGTGLFFPIANPPPRSPGERVLESTLSTTLSDSSALHDQEQGTMGRTGDRTSFKAWLTQAKKGAAHTKAQQRQHAAELHALTQQDVNDRVESAQATRTVFESPAAIASPSGKAEWEKQLGTISWQEAVDESVEPMETPRCSAAHAVEPEQAALPAEVALALRAAADALREHGRIKLLPLLQKCAKLRLSAAGSGRNEHGVAYDPLPLARVVALRGLVKVGDARCLAIHC